MTHLNNISHHLLRTALCLALLLCVSLGAGAQTSKWNGTSDISESLSGSGTEADPYLIQSAADLYHLQQTEDLWKLNSDNSQKHFKQMVDIDLNNIPFGPIGNARCTAADQAPNKADNTKAFRGVYDGNGKAIKNLYITWDNASEWNNKIGRAHV